MAIVDRGSFLADSQRKERSGLWGEKASEIMGKWQEQFFLEEFLSRQKMVDRIKSFSI